MGDELEEPEDVTKRHGSQEAQLVSATVQAAWEIKLSKAACCCDLQQLDHPRVLDCCPDQSRLLAALAHCDIFWLLELHPYAAHHTESWPGLVCMA